MQHHTSTQKPIRFLLATLATALLMFGSLPLPVSNTSITAGFGYAEAQSGGGFGGSRSGGSSSRGSSSSGGGSWSGGSSYPRGGSYGGPIIISNGGYGGGNYVSGGGMGIVPLIIFGIVIFVVLRGMRRSFAGGTGGLAMLGGSSGIAQAVSVQLLMAEGDEVKAALREVARTGDPDTNAGLARMLQEAALVALRHPERWVYGNVERAQGSASSIDSQVGSWATQARAAFTTQTTSNYQNKDPHSGFQQDKNYSFRGDPSDMYLAVTIAIAAQTLKNLPPAGVTTTAEARAALSAISSVHPDDLIRAEVVWSPDVEGEFLSEDEAIQKYPDLTKL